jgi:transposase
MSLERRGCAAIRRSRFISKLLECEPRLRKIIQQVREKISCRDYEAIIEPPAPLHAVPRGFAGSNLLAMILVFEVPVASAVDM